jgi:transposase
VGGKSRKSGGVSKKLIERLLREKEVKGELPKKERGGGKRKANPGLFELPDEGGRGA